MTVEVPWSQETCYEFSCLIYHNPVQFYSKASIFGLEHEDKNELDWSELLSVLPGTSWLDDLGQVT